MRQAKGAASGGRLSGNRGRLPVDLSDFGFMLCPRKSNSRGAKRACQDDVRARFDEGPFKFQDLLGLIQNPILGMGPRRQPEFLQVGARGAICHEDSAVRKTIDE